MEKLNRYKPFNFFFVIKIELFMFLFSRFFRFGVSHTPGIGRKRLLHLIATTPFFNLAFLLELKASV